MLTTEQLQTLKVAILADPALASQPMNDDGHFAVADALNAPAVPTFIVWKTEVPTKDVKDSVNWTEFIGRQPGERDAFTFLLSNGTINPARPNVRQGIADIFSGAGGVTSRTAIIALSKRSATRVEKLLATGIGSDATPATMTFEGALAYQDVRQARSS